jgi:hypothetical protein
VLEVLDENVSRTLVLNYFSATDISEDNPFINCGSLIKMKKSGMAIFRIKINIKNKIDVKNKNLCILFC